MEIVHRLIDVASHMEHDNSDYFPMTIVDFKVVANVLGSSDKGHEILFYFLYICYDDDNFTGVFCS